MLYFALATVLISPDLSSARGTEQDTLVPPSQFERLEIPDDEYVPVPREGQQTSPAYRSSTRGFFTVQVNVNDFGQNIVGDAANEPSIAIDPTDPNKIVMGWRQFDTINSNFRQAGYGYTADGGQTWTFPGVIEPGRFRSDPVLDSDSEGNFYFNSLRGTPFGCDVFKSDDGGATWDSGTFAHGGDKAWMVIDKTGGTGEGNIYAYWASYASVCLPGFFTRSIDGGASYESCITIPGDPFWGTLAVGPDGELYVCGARGSDFVVAKSSNAQDSSQSVSWDFSTTVGLDGHIVDDQGPNPAGALLGQAWIAVDRSTGLKRGNVYLLCSVERFSTSDPLDVMFARSTDGGVTWSSPVRVNDDPGNSAYQWFGTMSVAPDGRIDVIWLDTRDDPSGFHSSLYYSYSQDAGATWSPSERLSDPFDPHVGWPQQNKMGDYFDMVSDETGVHLAWAATFNGEQDVYYSHSLLPGSVIAIGPTGNSFGRVEVGSASDTVTITITNYGIDTLVVTNISAPGMHFSMINAPSTPVLIPPLETTLLTVAFEPQVAGDLTDSIVVSSNDSSKPTLAIALSGRGVVIGQAQAGILYAASLAPTCQLFTIDLATGAATPIGPTGVSQIRAMAIQPSTKEIYGILSGSVGTTLVRVSSAHGDAIPAAAIPLHNVWAIAFSQDDTLFAVANRGKLYRVDVSSGDTTFVGAAAGLFYSGLTLSPTSGELWASVIYQDKIYTVDQNDGSRTLVGSTGFNVTTRSIAFDGLGRLYGITGSNDVITIDTTTAAGTLIGSTGFTNIFALAMRTDSVVVAMAESPRASIPGSFSLAQNYPNPFNPSTTIRYELSSRSKVVLKIFNLLGQEVATLIDEEKEAGRYEVGWDASGFSSGIYFYRLKAGEFAGTKKLILAK